MPITTLFDIFYRDGATAASLETESATQADTVETALTHSGVPTLTSFSDIATYLTSPSSGDKVYISSTDTVYRYNGSTWKLWSKPWEVYTSAFSGGSVIGNGDLQARYCIQSGTVFFTIEYTAGTTDTFSGTFNFALPVNSSAVDPTGAPFGNVFMMDGGSISTRRSGTCLRASSTNVFIIVNSLAASATVNSTVPWTWASTDVIYISGSYEPAS